MKKTFATHSLSRALLALLTFVGLAGCDEPEPESSTLRGLTLDCPRWRCGYNTTEINGKSLQELHLGGQANADGVKLVGFLPPLGLLLNWQLGVEGDALVARGGLFGNQTLRGGQLIGSIMLLKVNSLLTVPVIIAGYEEVDSWAANGEPVAAYALVYVDLGQPLLQRSVCKGTLLDPLQASVVILAGERYDLDQKTVLADQTGWITLACAGSAAAKMSLLGYGPHAEFNDASAPTSVGQRQATLKMITADYCGVGDSYTEDGTALAWENQLGTVLPDGEAEALEAIWTERGAACLDTPRVAEIGEVACEIPSCDAFTLDDGEWATYNVE
jgi:ADYC domain